ncbi:PEP-CTERM sorting domain-containing protein [Parasphingorhabdus cellanae]|uniref:PEP-CTERM sorting domain-containing protein n=2 Tax=Parasphingorhabdus cellanae TaxID=2806553 RepID=A0ABX7T850_9SPHN|nr:PEP-CTERM sorting domain-containing protein [Parasphingorhabdus cellanae]
MDFSTAELSDLFDADPTVNVYSLSNTKVFASIGGYTTEFTPRFNFNSSLQLWDDRVVVDTTDAQSFRFFNFDFVPIDTNSFEVGTGQISESLGFSAFDFTAMARDNDLISQLAPLSAFGAQTLSYGLLNADTELFVGLNATVESSVLTAVPEPASWLMLILGFGIMGVFLRRSRVCIDKRAINARLPS